MKSNKCPNCGAPTKEIIEKNIRKCEYCGGEFSLDKESITKQIKTEEETSVLKENETISEHEERPRFNMFIFVFLFFMSFGLGVVYLVYKLHKQRKWDKEHLK